MIYKSIEIEPTVIAEDCGIQLTGYAGRAYRLARGDEFTLNDVAIKQTFNMPIKKIKLGKKINEYFMCTKKIKRRRWWQFWKPKYWGASFVYLGEENNDD